MPSDRIQRRIDQLLDAADEALGRRVWADVLTLCQQVVALDPGNADAVAYLAAAERGQGGMPVSELSPPPGPAAPPPRLPTAFVHDRYTVLSSLGEGARKQVYRAHDTLLDRDVAFARIRSEGLDAAARERVQREAQALGRLGSANIVAIYDVGEEDGAPFLVSEYLPGGDLA